MKKILNIAVVATWSFFVAVTGASAFWHGIFVGNGGNGQLNCGDMSIPTVMNLFKIMDFAAPGTGGQIGPQNLDALGYVVNKTGWATGGYGGETLADLPQGTGPYVLFWDASRSFTLYNNVSSTTSYIANATVTGGSNNNMTVVSKGSAGGTISSCNGMPVPANTGGCVVFTVAGSAVSFNFEQSGTYAPGTGEIALVAQANMALYVTSGQYWAPQYVSTLQALKVVTCRFMGDVINDGSYTNQTWWQYQNQVDSLSWVSQNYPPTVLAGSAGGGSDVISSAGSGAYPSAVDQYSAQGATDTPATYTDGERIEGYLTSLPTEITVSGSAQCSTGAGCTNNTDVLLTVSSTATLSNNQPVWIAQVYGTLEANSITAGGLHPTIITVVDGTHIQEQGVTYVNAYTTSTGVVGTQTINIAGRGAVFVGDLYNWPLYAGGSTDAPTTAGGFVDLIYNAKMGVMLWTSNRANGGVMWSVPYVVQAQLANLVHANIWTNTPAFANAAYVTNEASVLCSAVNYPLFIFPEWDNEVWNYDWPVTQFSGQTAYAMGLASVNDFYAYEVKQMELGFAAACPTSRLKRVLSWQSVYGGAGGAFYAYLRLNGQDLGVPSATITAISASAATPTATTAAVSPSYQQGVALVLSGVVGSGCTFLNGQTVYPWNPASTHFELSASPLGFVPINTAGCSYASGGTATALYTSLGYPSYSSSPNRPVDTTDVLAVAPYWGGSNFGGPYTLASALVMGPAMTDWVDGSYATAEAIVDNDIRQGTTYSNASQTLTFSCPGSPGTTITANNTFPSSGTTAIIFSATVSVCSGLTAGTVYCVSGATATTFKVATIVNGQCSGTLVTVGSGSGTQTVGIVAFQTLAYQQALVYAAWEALAASHDADPGRTAPLSVEGYEGGRQLLAPTVAQCTTMGLSFTSTLPTFSDTSGVGTPSVVWANSGLQNGDRVNFVSSGGTLPSNITSGADYFVEDVSTVGFDISSNYYIYAAYPGRVTVPNSTQTGSFTATVCQGGDNLLDGWLNSSYGFNTMLAYLNQFDGLDATVPQTYGLLPHFKYPSQLTLQGPNEWSLLPSPLQFIPTYYTPYQTYYAFQQFNFLLNRDLPGHPANDYGPVGLNAAA